MKFSILVPAYKPQFLAECIESILAQTYPNWELIIVNDASPYDIDSIVSKYDDERIHYRKREQGFGAKRLVENWNDCLNDATGDYVINMGDDDKLTQCCLHEYEILISKYPGKRLYHTRVEYINETSEITEVQDERPEEESVYAMMLRKLNGGRICIGEFLFETESLKENGGYIDLPYAWGADDISSYEAAIALGCANSNQCGFQYRDNGLSISTNNDIILEKYAVTFKWEDWLERFLQKKPDNSIDIEKWKTIKRTYHHCLVAGRQWYVDVDIQNRQIFALIYWLKRIRGDKSAELKSRTLFVFLYYAIKNKQNWLQWKKKLLSH